MTATTITHCPSFAHSSPRQARSGLTQRLRLTLAGRTTGDGQAPAAGTSHPTDTSGHGTGCTTEKVSTPGAIGAALLKAARHSAGISRRTLARRLNVTATTVRAWENGTTPLYLVDYSLLHQLASALGPADGAASLSLRRLVIASQCDLLIADMLDGSEDYAEVPPIEDDTADGQTARDLLRWALTGTAPSLWQSGQADGRVGSGMPLLADAEVARIAAVARGLRDSDDEDGLAGFGQSLEHLTRP